LLEAIDEVVVHEPVIPMSTRLITVYTKLTYRTRGS
jgi:hypothetical protein